MTKGAHTIKLDESVYFTFCVTFECGANARSFETSNKIVGLSIVGLSKVNGKGSGCVERMDRNNVICG